MIFTLKQHSLPWLCQRISAALLVVIVWLHFHLIFRRFLASGTLSYGELQSLLSNPLYKVLELVFFFLAFYHGFYGVWNICVLWIRNNRFRTMLKAALWSIGTGLFLWMGLLVIAV